MAAASGGTRAITKLAEHAGERQALYNLHAALKPLLTHSGEYAQALNEARDGLIPGV